MFQLQHTPGRTAMVDGKEYLFFSGYSYLGMNHVPEFVELVKEGIDKYGWVFPSSRISNTQLGLFEEFENRLSEITGTENSVCFSSGFLAARAVHAIYNDQKIICAPHTHPALCIETSTQNSFEEWSDTLEHASVIAFDSVNPLTAEVNNTSFLNGISQPLTCIIDDSHGAGILNQGYGIVKSLPRRKNIEQVVVYSMSKAYNLIGGTVSCTTEVANRLKANPLYTASSSISPALAYAFLHSQHLYDELRSRLSLNVERFRSITGNRFKSHFELPIFILPDEVDEGYLIERNILVSSFAYPDPRGKNIKRVVLNALHTEDDLIRLAEALQ